jgi:hypothetical protein
MGLPRELRTRQTCGQYRANEKGLPSRGRITAQSTILPACPGEEGVAGSNLECTGMPSSSPYVGFERNQSQGVIKIVVTDAQPLSPKSVAGLPLITIAAAPFTRDSATIEQAPLVIARTGTEQPGETLP